MGDQSNEEGFPCRQQRTLSDLVPAERLGSHMIRVTCRPTCITLGITAAAITLCGRVLHIHDGGADMDKPRSRQRVWYAAIIGQTRHIS